ncbi:MAG: TetR/AcrR family transcriptional regulator [Anaerolineae bacterium]|nr:TetR/AcrR family transcriptional regulator [Anaerolineae bacterium]
MTSDLPIISLGNIDEDGRSERKDAAANRKLILETAEALFAEKGVENVCMAEIAQAAGVGKGTLYRRFANKAELCLALMDTQMVEFQNRMLAEFRKMTVNRVPQMAQLEFFMDGLVHFTDAHAPLLSEVQSEGLLQERRSTEMPHFWQYMTVHGLFQTAIDAGELPQGLDTEYLADALLSPLMVDIFRFQREVRGFSLERISEGLRVLIAGLRHCVD